MSFPQRIAKYANAVVNAPTSTSVTTAAWKESTQSSRSKRQRRVQTAAKMAAGSVGNNAASRRLEKLLEIVMTVNRMWLSDHDARPQLPAAQTPTLMANAPAIYATAIYSAGNMKRRHSAHHVIIPCS